MLFLLMEKYAILAELPRTIILMQLHMLTRTVTMRIHAVLNG